MRKKILLAILPALFLLVFVLIKNSNAQDFTIACDKEVYYCLMNCEAICNITNNLDKAVKVNASAIFNSSGVSPKNIWEWKNITYNETVYDYGNVAHNQTCFNIPINDTYQSWEKLNENGDYICNLTEQVLTCLNLYTTNVINDTCEYNSYEIIGYHQEEKWKWDWKEVDKWIILAPNKQIKGEIDITPSATKKVKFDFEVPINSKGKFNITAKDEGNGYFGSLDPWWNSMWQLRRQLNITNTGTYAKINEPVLVNLTGLTFSSVNELRIVDDTSNSIIPYEVLNYSPGVGNAWAWVVFNASVPAGSSNTKIYVYYNNTEAPNPNYGRIYFNGTGLFDNFNSTSMNQWINVGYCISSFESNTLKMTKTYGDSGDCYARTVATDFNASRGMQLMAIVNRTSDAIGGVSYLHGIAWGGILWTGNTVWYPTVSYVRDQRAELQHRYFVYNSSALGSSASLLPGIPNFPTNTRYWIDFEFSQNSSGYVNMNISSWQEGTSIPTSPQWSGSATNDLSASTTFLSVGISVGWQGGLQSTQTTYYDNFIARSLPVLEVSIGVEEILTYLSVTFSYASIDFGSVTPYTTAPAPNQYNGIYNVTVDTNANYRVKAYADDWTGMETIPASTLYMDTSSTAANLKFEDAKQLSTASETIDTYPYTTTNNYHGFWFDVPLAKTGTYSTTIHILYENV